MKWLLVTQEKWVYKWICSETMDTVWEFTVEARVKPRAKNQGSGYETHSWTLCFPRFFPRCCSLRRIAGIEIVNPNAAEKKAEEEDGCSTYFSNMSSFVKLAPRNVQAKAQWSWKGRLSGSRIPVVVFHPAAIWRTVEYTRSTAIVVRDASPCVVGTTGRSRCQLYCFYSCFDCVSR